MKYRYNDASLPCIVIIGGGFAGLELIKKLQNKPFRVVLIDKNNYHTFQPLLYQIASAGLTAEQIAYPFRRKIGGFPNIIYRMAEVLNINTTTNTVHTNSGDFSYDHLIIATGASSNFYGNKELEKFSRPLKSVSDALHLRSAILKQFEKAIVAVSDEDKKYHLNFIIAGGGPTGVELAGALAEIRRNVVPHDYRELSADFMQVQLIEGGKKLLSSMSEQSSDKAKKYLEQLGVQVKLNTLVKEYTGTEIILSDGSKLRTESVIWTAGVKGSLVAGINSRSIAKGSRYLTDGRHKIEGYNNIYAIGDIAFMTADKNYPDGHPGVAQVAIQMADNLSGNFIRERSGFLFNRLGFHSYSTVAPYVTFVSGK